ncbi:hypothetical protein QYE76_061563 [Lolium multiflorum]|uniref:Uncharacterized protein n=1 Tax=Lolium multiflorum TaxID=4521 RepID=A0AAD8W5B3_LOLMU|nr:hypothetical protein QYE76_061563 [Lolium multiflorum]
MPSPDRRAHEEVAEAELGRQQHQRSREGIKDAKDAGRVRFEVRDAVEHAAARELALCGKQIMTPQEEDRALAARTEKRRAPRRDAAGKPPPGHPAGTLEWNPHAYRPPASSEIHGCGGEWAASPGLLGW